MARVRTGIVRPKGNRSMDLCSAGDIVFFFFFFFLRGQVDGSQATQALGMLIAPPLRIAHTTLEGLPW
jgi:hypothetical protein